MLKTRNKTKYGKAFYKLQSAEQMSGQGTETHC